MQSGTAATVWIVGGGALHLRVPLMQRLRDRGFQMAAVGPEARPEFARHGFPYFRIPFRRAFNPLADHQAQRRLCELFSRHRPDLVHAVNTKPGILVPKAARQAGIRNCIRTITGLGALFSSSSPSALAMRVVYRYLQRQAAEGAAITVFQNPDDRDYFLQHRLVRPGREALVLSSGIDVDQFRLSVGKRKDALPQSLDLRGRPVVTMISRLLKSKGVVEYLKAAAMVRQRHPEVVFLLIGNALTEGPQAVSVSRLDRSAADVRYLGRRNDVADLLCVSDMFVLPSYLREGVPRVLLEAGAMDLPLITTDTPGCREVVRDGWNGLLVRPRDPHSLSQAIIQLLDSSQQRRSMGQRSRCYVQEHFNLARVSDAYAEIYRRVLNLRAFVSTNAENPHRIGV